MKKRFIGLLLLFMCTMSIQAFAGKNTLKFAPGFKVGTDIAAVLLDIEYERKILPLTSVFIKYGTSDFDLDTTNSGTESTVSFEFTNMAVGMRYSLFLFHVGFGYESTSMDLSDETTGGSANGSITGPFVEIGKSIGLGPIGFGANFGVQFADVDVDYDTGSDFNIGDIPEGGSMTLYRANVEASFSF